MVHDSFTCRRWWRVCDDELDFRLTKFWRAAAGANRVGTSNGGTPSLQAAHASLAETYARRNKTRSDRLLASGRDEMIGRHTSKQTISGSSPTPGSRRARVEWEAVSEGRFNAERQTEVCRTGCRYRRDLHWFNQPQLRAQHLSMLGRKEKDPVSIGAWVRSIAEELANLDLISEPHQAREP